MELEITQSTPDTVPADRLLRLIFWTSAASRQLRGCLASLANSAGISDGELLTLWLCLGEEGGMVQGELAAALGVSPAQMSGIVERLRQRGLIEMHRQALDRRRQVWRGTAAARQVLELLAVPLANLADHLSAHLTPDEQQTALALGQRLASAAEAWPAGIDCNSLGNMADGSNAGSTRKAA